ncbi:MAG TPA: NUDIX domain-containing protein [Ktedonobacterales bacterium]|nr:NUDIX domain-containing protein [Ktedonobacterales bacterium]
MAKGKSTETTSERVAGAQRPRRRAKGSSRLARKAPDKTQATQYGSSTARFRIGVYALIERDGRYLLARRSDIGWWNLPGGGLEYNETLAEGLAREVQEEVHLNVAVEQLVGVYEKPQKREFVLAFRCRQLDAAEPSLSSETTEVGWFAPDALPERTLPKHAQRVRDAALQHAEALIRAQTTTPQEDQHLT